MVSKVMLTDFSHKYTLPAEALAASSLSKTVQSNFIFIYFFVIFETAFADDDAMLCHCSQKASKC